MQVQSLGRKIPGVGSGNLLQFSCLENSVDRGAWRAKVHGVTKSCTLLSSLSCTHVHAHMHTHTHTHTHHMNRARSVEENNDTQ